MSITGFSNPRRFASLAEAELVIRKEFSKWFPNENEAECDLIMYPGSNAGSGMLFSRRWVGNVAVHSVIDFVDYTPTYRLEGWQVLFQGVKRLAI